MLKRSPSLTEQAKSHIKQRILNEGFEDGRIPSETDLANELGRSDYSYWFVLNYFRPMLEGLGEVVVLSAPDQRPTPDPAARDVLLLFMPPHTIPLELADRAIPVFAWEYTTIPTEPWAGESRNDWRTVLGRSPGAITHSRFAAAAVREAMGADYPVVSLPAPVWDRYAPLAQRPHTDGFPLAFTGAVIDSRRAGLAQGPGQPLPDTTPGPQELTLSGAVYTSVVNPNDGRKVWEDTITAFVWAHRDTPDATLLLKLVHFDKDTAIGIVWDFMRRLAPYRCRIVALHSYLPTEQFEQLMVGSTFVVNSSRGEGQCLPLMEFMSAGVPAIAPDHTAMAEYIDNRDALVVASSAEWTHWPHDPRRFLRCLMHPVTWDSLRAAFVEGQQIATGDQGRYRQMRDSAVAALEAHCSIDVIRARMVTFLAELPGPQSAPHT